MTAPADPTKPGSGRDWLNHAASDLRFARLGLADPDVMRNQVAFHAQQAAEKSLKAVLVDQSLRFPRTHDLAALVEMLQLAGVPLPATIQIEALTPFAVETRYPGVFAQVTTQEAGAAIDSATAVFEWASQFIK